ncbi:MAG: Rrf2 family transcriptional regulator [Bryobacterales bacterium]|nr:Rrf2 family transcriptional regulator [Bryobacterales bacterium]
MIYSRSAEYAIRAFVYLAQVEENKFVMARQIAADTDIPGHFLAKILQQLARKAFLRSSKGPTGGFCLRKKANEVSLFDVIEAVDGTTDYERCIGGQAECNDNAPCGLHDSWKKLRSDIVKYLEETSILDVAQSMDQKVKALSRVKKRKTTAKK